MKKFSDFIIEKRMLFLIIISLISLFFMYKLTNLEVYTKFADLLPQGHEYIKLHNQIRSRFGGANTVIMVLQTKEGDIFNTTTLNYVEYNTPRPINQETLVTFIDKISQLIV